MNAQALTFLCTSVFSLCMIIAMAVTSWLDEKKLMEL